MRALNLNGDNLQSIYNNKNGNICFIVDYRTLYCG